MDDVPYTTSPSPTAVVLRKVSVDQLCRGRKSRAIISEEEGRRTDGKTHAA